jgi:hypothetical protein
MRNKHLYILVGLLMAGIIFSVIQLTQASPAKPNPGHSWTEIEFPSDCGSGNYVYGINASGWKCRAEQGGGGISGIGGSGTANYLSKFTATSTLGNSQIFDNGTNVGIGIINPSQRLEVAGYIKGTGICIGNDCKTSWPTGAGGLPSGRSGQTLRHDGKEWVANSLIYNDGTNVGIGTTNPGNYKLYIKGDHYYTLGVESSNELGTWVEIKNSRSGGMSNLRFMDNDGVFGLIAATKQWSPKGMQLISGEGKLLIGFDGKVGIGTEAPGQKLDVKGGYIRSDTGFCIGESCITTWPSGGGGIGGSGTTNYIPIWTGSTSLGNSVIYQNNGRIGIGTTDPRSILDVAGTLNIEGGTFGLKINSGLAAFYDGVAITDSSWDPDLTIQGTMKVEKGANLATKSGNVGIGTETPQAKLQVGTSGDGTIAVANAWTTFSSRTWKENIKPIEGALEKVKRLNGIYFDWKGNGKQDIGMIAEDVGKVIPEIVAYEENGIEAKSIDYGRLTPLLIEAVKEQQKEIEELKLQLNSLGNIGTPEIQTGITIYDKVTKEPYCLSIENGEFFKTKGKCSE